MEPNYYIVFIITSFAVGNYYNHNYILFLYKNKFVWCIRDYFGRDS